MLCITVTHKRFYLFYCIVATVIVCHFVRSLMSFVCQEIKGLLAYLLTYHGTPACDLSFRGKANGYRGSGCSLKRGSITFVHLVQWPADDRPSSFIPDM